MNLRLADIPGQRFECRGCTTCCRDLVVHLTRRDIDAIDGQNWTGRIDGPAYVRLGRETVLNHRADGGCVFLSPDGKCRIHSEYGAEAKPLACRLYPFTLEPESGALQVGIRFDCPTVARNDGAHLTSHRPALTTLARAMSDAMPEHFVGPRTPTLLAPGRPASDRELDDIVKRVDRLLAAEHVPLPIRLRRLCTLTDTLGQARLGTIRDERLVELLDLLMDDAEADNHADLDPADGRQRKLLRQHAFAHMEHITLAQARASFIASLSYRWGQFQRSRQIANAVDGSAAHADAMTPANSTAESGRFVTRYLRARVLTYSTFGSAYYGWSVLDGLRSLILAVATVGWLARYRAASAGRDSFDDKDILHAVGVVDRAAGRAAELGAKSARLRVGYLQREHGLLRLLAAYPIMADQRP
ncbi:MAG: YkgJ family cysteine cluster protein [Planctomycetes bacterium]|nr:YkgJ family cysteine cluster protein [Planctomycetota bacterium]